MELFAIMLSFPMSFLCSTIYAVIINRITKRWTILFTPLFWISFLILILLLVEVTAVIFIGALGLREAIGPPYFPIHLFLFFLALPSAVNIMKLQRIAPLFAKWYAIGSVCAFLGLGIVLLQYAVSEALYGIDGMGGPYGPP
jgi:hypothetical protein